ncbi:hypothetical protein MVEN_01958800 [Mycena venus]|uniref:Uncharacterized protein n=1 Tax=Mycena venus TaxID=2733690 RepID=A0A8H7CM50_9AGAR|nr:hypothetical protein MVEN_01958800 [Mycena venus]
MVSELYFFQCSKSTVPQKGTVDCRTGESSSLIPTIHKDESVWQSATLPDLDGNLTTSNPTMVESDWWSTGLESTLEEAPTSGIPFSLKNFDTDLAFSFADVYLIEHLGLATFSDINGTSPPPTLHDVENTLSSLVASMFWILGHVLPGSLETTFRARLTTFVGTVDSEFSIPPIIPPVLSVGSATVQVPTPASHLHLSVPAVMSFTYCQMTRHLQLLDLGGPGRLNSFAYIGYPPFTPAGSK